MGTAGKGNAGMKTNIMTGICVFVILCLLAALLIVLAAGRAREKKLLRRLQEMLEDASAGTFLEGKLCLLYTSDAADE